VFGVRIQPLKLSVEMLLELMPPKELFKQSKVESFYITKIHLGQIRELPLRHAGTSSRNF
jgi:hypothetical protein